MTKFIFGLAKSYLVKKPKQIEKIGRFRKTFCKIIVRCGENVGKIGYKNGLQVSVGHLRVPYDVLFSNEFLRDLSRLWELRDIVPDPANLPWGPLNDK